MYNLTHFDPKKELKRFENSKFAFDTNEQFSLNEKDEKIWNYLVIENEKTLPLIFQIMWYQNQLLISYSTEHTGEEVRQKASQIAHRIRALFRQKIKAPILLEQPIIADFDLYQENTLKFHLKTQVEAIVYHLESLTSSDTPNIFQFYGQDGLILGQALHGKTGIVFNQKQDNTYELTIAKEISVSERETFMTLVREMGYGITYQEIEAYDDVTTLQNLFASGLLQIEQPD